MDARSCAPEITDDSFEAEVLDEDRPVLVFFRAAWCGPCRMVGPIVDEVIADHGGKLKVLELCTDENPKTVAEFKIRNIPTLMLFSDRKSVMTVVGAVPKSALVSSIKKHMDL
ncbi:Thiol-disulfide isomerase and thioredoxin [Ectocarpus siliculosus]|uniref:Thioredoxin n=1 Tax=Ectocarpus siliculosus TaxID=2880 RepID=D7G7W3_ECTSI|nr:Thiol-disulfide isomerase and thioredoxin [Ectocarpus siliculosus]|eukprot:CBJ27844.1 Thiol-disulfide isomerase and thioredoxin [Ectocarpus siliculosus]